MELTTEQIAAAEAAASEGAGEKGKSAEERAVYLEGELKKVISQRDEMKRRAKELEKAEADLKKIREGEMTSVEKAIARVKELEPLAAEAASLRETFDAMLTREVESIPEEYRDLVPSKLPPHERLAWIHDARSRGIFGGTKAEASAGARKPAAGTGNTIKRSEYNALPLGGRWEDMTNKIRRGEIKIVEG